MVLNANVDQFFSVWQCGGFGLVTLQDIPSVFRGIKYKALISAQLFQFLMLFSKIYCSTIATAVLCVITLCIF